MTSEPQPKRLMKKSIVVVIIIIAVVVAALVFSFAVITDVIVLRKTEDMNGSENAVSVLWVGSSQIFVGNVPQHLQVIAGANGFEVIYKDLSRHGNRGGTLSELSVKAINEMQNHRYDYIVLQDQTRRSHSDTNDLLNKIQILCEAAREHGTIPVIYNSAWATANGKPDEAHLRTSTEVSKFISMFWKFLKKHLCKKSAELKISAYPLQQKKSSRRLRLPCGVLRESPFAPFNRKGIRRVNQKIIVFSIPL